MNMTRAAEASIQAVSPVSILGTGTSSSHSGAVTSRLYGREVSGQFRPCFAPVNSRGSAVSLHQWMEAVVVAVETSPPGGVAARDRPDIGNAIVRNANGWERDGLPDGSVPALREHPGGAVPPLRSPSPRAGARVHGHLREIAVTRARIGTGDNRPV